MKILLGQIDTTVGDFDGNLKKILTTLKLGEKKGVDLVICPELAICGYPPRDLLEKSSFIKKGVETLNSLAEKVGDVGLILGHISENNAPHGKRLFSSASLIHKGKIIFTQHKTHLPNYDVFDETRHFQPADSHSIVKFKSKNIGIVICEDLWTEMKFDGRALYSFDPVKEYKRMGADLIISVSASPYHLGKLKIRQDLLKANASKHDIPIIYLNSVGANDELVFDGRSMVYNRSGNLCNIAASFEEEDLVVDLDKLSPMNYNPISDEEELFEALSLGLKDYVKKCGFDKVLLGVSGGIDSALVASIAVHALGRDKVMGVSMPSPYTSKESFEDARILAANLMIEFKEIPITKIYEGYRELLGRKGELSAVDENLQARIRGNILMAISNETGALLLSTGNKSELAVGYCTLYGDMAGGLALISDLPKTWVYRLSNFVNRGSEVIPKRIIKKAPSAELRPDQRDEDELLPYSALDKILESYIEDMKGFDDIVKLGVDRATAKRIIERIDKNEYKRRQASIGIKVTNKAFGSGRRFPIAHKGSV